MILKLSDLTFEEWVRHVFDHHAGEPDWYWDPEDDVDEDAPDRAVSYMERLFLTADKVLLPFTDAQVYHGLTYIICSGFSTHMFALVDETISWPDRQRCISSIVKLFEDFFTLRCMPDLANDSLAPVNNICFMWFETIPIYPDPHKPEQAAVEKEFLNVMEAILEIDHDVCRESALHGLGHWEAYYRGRVHNIVRRFLRHNLFLRSELRAYARNAWDGNVQ